MNDERIQDLNNQILESKKKIKMINIFDDVVSYTLSGGIVLCSSIAVIKNYGKIVQELTSVIMISTILLGSAPLVCFPTRRNMKKTAECNLKIKEAMNELHGYALEEDKKLMLKKS